MDTDDPSKVWSSWYDVLSASVFIGVHPWLINAHCAPQGVPYRIANLTTQQGCK